MYNLQATYTVMTIAAHIVGGLGDLHALPLDAREALSEEEAKLIYTAHNGFAPLSQHIACSSGP